MNKKGQMAGIFDAVLNLIMVSVIILIAIFLMSSVSESFSNPFNESLANNNTNSASLEFISGSATIIFVIIFLGLMIGAIFKAFSLGAGGFEGSEDNEDDSENDDDDDDEKMLTIRYVDKNIEGSSKEVSEEKTYDKNKFEGKSKYD